MGELGRRQFWLDRLAMPEAATPLSKPSNNVQALHSSLLAM